MNKNSSEQCRKRREAFYGSIGAEVAIIPAAPAPVKSNDVEHEYHQDPDFYYLTGFEEPEAIAVFTPGNPAQKFTLFLRPRDPEKELWNGRRFGLEGALEYIGADIAHPIEEFEKTLAELLVGNRRLHYRIGRVPEIDRLVLRGMEEARGRVRKGGIAPSEIVDPGVTLSEHRLLKNAEEISLLRRACAISCEAHIAAMRACVPGMHEFELEAVIEWVFRNSGSAGPAYPSIVGAGKNATVLHYSTNQETIGPDDLVLIDAGCEWQYYCADITRTFPSGGKFTRGQREIYELVLDAQQEAIREVVPGAPYEKIHQRAVRVLTEGMLRLGLLSGDPAELIEKEEYKRFYPHGTGHWIGLDVHDAGVYKIGETSRTLVPGMVLTVEPGLYIQPDDASAPEHLRGIGIRIEDDLLVTGTGCENLTAAAPKNADEIEKLVGRTPGMMTGLPVASR